MYARVVPGKRKRGSTDGKPAGPVAQVYLGLGSNIGDREANLRGALCRLAEKVAIDAVSGLYETAPMGPQDQPRYLNAACRGTTKSGPRDLLAFIKQVEHGMGRVPVVRWGPRIIDIDILLYNSLVLHTSGLMIPHPGVSDRAFVLVPLADIAADLVHPALGEPVSALLERLLNDADEVHKVAAPGEWYPCTK